MQLTLQLLAATLVICLHFHPAFALRGSASASSMSTIYPPYPGECPLKNVVPSAKMWLQDQIIGRGDRHNETKHVWFLSPCEPELSARNPTHPCQPRRGYFQKWGKFHDVHNHGPCEFSLDTVEEAWKPVRHPKLPEVVGFAARFSGNATGNQSVLAFVEIYCDTSRPVYFPMDSVILNYRGSVAIYNVQIGDPAVCNATGLTPITVPPKDAAFCTHMNNCSACVSGEGHGRCGYCQTLGECIPGSEYGPFETTCPLAAWKTKSGLCDLN